MEKLKESEMDLEELFDTIDDKEDEMDELRE